MNKWWDKAKHYLIYGFFMALMVFFLKWIQWRFLIMDNAIDIYIGIIAIFFTLFGGWLATTLLGSAKSIKPPCGKVVPVAQEPLSGDTNKSLDLIGLTSREAEILLLITKGLSNEEIADRLFLSISTVKTHVSNLYTKMEVKRRSQAIEKAIRLGIVSAPFHT